MRKLFKSASVASLALAASAALFLTDASFASESADGSDDMPESEIVIDPAMIDSSDTDEATGVVFAKSQEIVSEIPADVIAADKAANAVRLEQEAAAQANADFNDSNAGSLRELVNAQSTSGALTAEMECLAGAVYFESKSESLKGQLAVARVVMARAESSRFPNSLCGVVYQRKQFSFVRGGKMPRINRGHKQWRNAVAISKIALNDGWKSPVEGALFFHARYVSPGWRLTRMAAVDNHIFYR